MLAEALRDAVANLPRSAEGSDSQRVRCVFRVFSSHTTWHFQSFNMLQIYDFTYAWCTALFPLNNQLSFPRTCLLCSHSISTSLPCVDMSHIVPCKKLICWSGVYLLCISYFEKTPISLEEVSTHMLRWSNGFPSNFALRCHRFPVPVRSLLLAAGLGMGCHSDWSSEGCEGLQRALFGGADYAPLRIRALSEATCDGLQVMLRSRRSTSLISIFEVIWKPTHSLSGSCIEAMQEDLDLSMTKCPLEFQICIYSYMFYNIHLISRCFFSCRHYSFSQCAARQFEYVLTRQGIQEFTALLWLIGSDVCLNQLNPR